MAPSDPLDPLLPLQARPLPSFGGRPPPSFGPARFGGKPSLQRQTTPPPVNRHTLLKTLLFLAVGTITLR